MVKLPFNPVDLDSKDKAIYEAMVAKRKSQGAPFDGPYAALMNHPELCQKIEALGYYLKFEGHLPRDIYQFVVLSVAKETNAAFEWMDHVQHALAAGVPKAVAESIHAHGILGQSFPEPYQLAAQVLNATLVWKNIPEQVQADAIKKYGMYGFVEIVVLSGFYQMFAAINQGFDVSHG
ncbi:carboxymuconolactone decarboxylase [Candidatus Protochlamydia phocaeensis]|uniref:carboxymuconolactone decarboxylase n=1 Tax=Candidatus Protochlamydia phocaeensis TaxID=1414722 RepID=UPI00083912EA|nr:carboxymuconolactone decarboxylase [Candidatus Protochlamydia phocaeensis]